MTICKLNLFSVCKSTQFYKNNKTKRQIFQYNLSFCYFFVVWLVLLLVGCTFVLTYLPPPRSEKLEQVDFPLRVVEFNLLKSENSLGLYYANISSTFFAASRPLAMARTTRLAPFKASPHTTTFEGISGICGFRKPMARKQA